MKKLLRFFTSRITISIILILLQLFLLYQVVVFLNNNIWFYVAFATISIVEIFTLLNKDILPEYKLAWIMHIIFLPVFGIFLYLLLRRKPLKKALSVKMNLLKEENANSKITLPKATVKDSFASNLSNLIYSQSSFHMQDCKKIEYFDFGEKYFADMLKNLKRAKKFILIEFFIVHDGFLWNQIFNVLKEKAESGVEVKIMVDDFGTMFSAKRKFRKILKKSNINIEIFNKVRPIIDSSYNNRTHRKIVVIDGVMAYSGGCNIGDEYINHIRKFGLWKDTGFKVEGNAVTNFTLAFLHLYSLQCPYKVDFEKYLVVENEKGNRKIQFFYDNPNQATNIFFQSYIKILQNAKKYVYINSPYLIIDSQMKGALISASKSGVDVRITLPKIPDKKYAYELALENADHLSAHGVKVYLYAPGFIHAKSFLSDDKYAIIGTSNLDYRSLFLNFECGAFVYDEAFATDMKTDYMKTLEYCELYIPKKTSFMRKIKRAILSLFAPLL